MVNIDGTAALLTGPSFTFLLQELFHPHLPDHSEILQGGFFQGIPGSIPVFFLHNVLTGIIRAFVTESVSVFLTLPAKDDPTLTDTEFKLVVIRTVAARAGVIFGQGLGTQAAVQAAGSNHISSKH